MKLTMPQRAAAFAAIVVVCAVGVVGYLLHEHRQQSARIRSAPPVATTSVASVAAVPHITFRSTALGDTYGKVAMVPISDPGGPRAVTGTDCDRVYEAGSHVLCVAANRGVATTYSATVLDQSFHEVWPLDLSGVASRARLSSDGSFAATTTFVSGHSYAAASFSTQTLVTRIGGKSFANVEDFTLLHRGKVIEPVDRNVWGVTFVNDDEFYVTVAWGGHTWLSKGSLNERRLVTVREDAECPSVSPDGSHVAYKKRLNLPPGQWRLAVLDLHNGKETMTAETRSVDDQVEWLDGSTVIYGLPRSGSEAAISDVWGVAADGSGEPRKIISGAWSPAVVRSAP